MKVSIIGGGGLVGSSAAVALQLGKIVREIRLVDVNQDLVAGRIDATQADSIALDAFLASPEGSACCELMGAVADDPAVLGLGVGVGLRKGDEALKEKFNAAIAAVRADGTYDSITANYFSSSIYGE